MTSGSEMQRTAREVPLIATECRAILASATAAVLGIQ